MSLTVFQACPSASMREAEDIPASMPRQESTLSADSRISFLLDAVEARTTARRRRRTMSGQRISASSCFIFF